MRRFTRILFFGTESCYKGIVDLHELLREGLAESGGCQQPAHPESAEAAQADEREQRLALLRVETIVRDIAMALTGKEITFIDEEKHDP